MTNRNYKGKRIDVFATIAGKTRIEFNNTKSLASLVRGDIFVKINGVKYTFKYSWGMCIYDGAIFDEGKSYDIEISN